MSDSIHECWINQKVRIKNKGEVKEEFLRGRRKEGKYIID